MQKKCSKFTEYNKLDTELDFIIKLKSNAFSSCSCRITAENTYSVNYINQKYKISVKESTIEKALLNLLDSPVQCTKAFTVYLK